MAGFSLLALIDDITTLLDDIAVLAKTSAKKAGGVLGDDFAVSANQLHGMRADRELPVVYAVAKGSLINKAFLVPGALLVSAFAPWAILPLLVLGGLYLCFEGSEKVLHHLLSTGHAEDDADTNEEAKAAAKLGAAEYEKRKIKGAVRTDLVLSLEIVVITLGTVAGASLIKQFAVLVLVALLVTIGVYGIVAAIVRLDDWGLALMKKDGERTKAVGRFLVSLAPKVLRFLSIFGTVAMFLVGGGIVVHALPKLGEAMHELDHWAAAVPAVGTLLEYLASPAVTIVLGFAMGAVLVVAMSAGERMWKTLRG